MMRKFEDGDLVKLVSTRKDNNRAHYIPAMEHLLGKTSIVEYVEHWGGPIIRMKCPEDIDDRGYINFDELCFRRIRKAINVKKKDDVKVEVPKVEEVKPIALKEGNDPTGLRAYFTKSMGDADPATCSYAIKLANGKIREQKRDVCHARLPLQTGDYLGHKQEKDPIAVVLHLKGHYKNAQPDLKETYVKYVDYMINRSPWAPIHLVKDAHDAIANCASLDVSRPLYELMGAAVSLREASEFPSNFRSFKKALELGYSEHTAYLMTCCFITRESGDSCRTYITNGHKVMHTDNKVPAIINFFTKGYKPAKEAYNKGGIDNGINKYMMTIFEGSSFKNAVDALAPLNDWAFGTNGVVDNKGFISVADMFEKFFKKAK
jgi:hypothetical protein